MGIGVVTPNGTASYTGASASTHAVNVPSGTLQGHLLICVIYWDSGEDTTLSWTSPGWTSLGAQDGGGGTDNEHGWEFFWRIAPASPPSTYTFTSTGSADSLSCLMCAINEHNASTNPPTATLSGETWGTDPDPPSHTASVSSEFWMAFTLQDEEGTLSGGAVPSFTALDSVSYTGTTLQSQIDTMYSMYQLTTATTLDPAAGTATNTGRAPWEMLTATMAIQEGTEVGVAPASLVAGSLSLMGVGR